MAILDQRLTRDAVVCYFSKGDMRVLVTDWNTFGHNRPFDSVRINDCVWAHRDDTVSLVFHVSSRTPTRVDLYSRHDKAGLVIYNADSFPESARNNFSRMISDGWALHVNPKHAEKIPATFFCDPPRV